MEPVLPAACVGTKSAYFARRRTGRDGPRVVGTESRKDAGQWGSSFGGASISQQQRFEHGLNIVKLQNQLNTHQPAI